MHPKLVSPLGNYSWKKSDFCQFFQIEESGASDVSKIKFLKTKGIRIWKQNSNSWVKTIYIFSFKFLNSLTIILTRANLENGPTQNSKFSKFDLTSWFHLFYWLKNTPYLNFRFKNDRIICTCFYRLLRLLSLQFWKTDRNCSSSMNIYIKEKTQLP